MAIDITYCASDCKCINCLRNKANITDHSVLHSWCLPEGIPDCPIRDAIEFDWYCADGERRTDDD